ncbi:hypothetical protein KIN20_018189 [Parelaphostrongylus tenuis]|uniref:Uncharacterized protein n=1 Tax=Parelaphostrongylus tenuis TaxID=148309 RepID=A0AAD5N3C0_PARTN|nr:hypothetical protein KIN20_018189 [Parelaphostrongylus tenuis]
MDVFFTKKVLYTSLLCDSTSLNAVDVSSEPQSTSRLLFPWRRMVTGMRRSPPWSPRARRTLCTRNGTYGRQGVKTNGSEDERSEEDTIEKSIGAKVMVVQIVSSIGRKTPEAIRIITNVSGRETINECTMQRSSEVS